MDPIDVRLQSLAEANLLRRLRAIEVLGPTRGRVDGREVVLFSSNDYLGLSAHPRVIERTIEATREYGLGPRGSALLCGWTSLHQQLCDRLARFFGTEACHLFPTGYLANLGVLQALGRLGGTLASDERNHASLVDGCRLSRLAVKVYPHADVEALDALLSATPGRKTIVSDSVFSMDGDAAPVARLAEVAARHAATLLLDEAHAFLVRGPGGRGAWEEAGRPGGDVVRVGTLSKAFGALGGFVLGSRRFVDLVVNDARAGMFATALPVPIVAAALAAIDVMESDETPRDRLWRNVRVAAEAFPVRVDSPIAPVLLGTEERALSLSSLLFERGFHVPAVRPPTVPPGTSRLRVTLTAAHTEEEVRALGGLLRAFATPHSR